VVSHRIRANAELPVLIPVAVPVTTKVTAKVTAVIPIMAVAIVAIVVITTIVAVAEGENVRDFHILFPSSLPRTLLGKILDVPLCGALSVTRPLWAALLDRGRGYTDDVDPRFDIAPGGGPVGWPVMGTITAPRSDLRVFAGEVSALTPAAWVRNPGAYLVMASDGRGGGRG
jgi:hypothetical protein